MTDININEVYEELKYLGDLPETSRLIKAYLALREDMDAKDAEIARLKAYIAENDINGDTAVACLTEIKNAVDEKMAEIDLTTTALQILRRRTQGSVRLLQTF